MASSEKTPSANAEAKVARRFSTYVASPYLGAMVALLLAPAALAEYPELTALKRSSVRALEEAAKRMAAVDKKFEGVIGFGKSLSSLPEPGKINIAQLTYQNKDYWRATMELVRYDPSVLFAHGHLHAANGEIERATTYFILGSIIRHESFESEQEAFVTLREKLLQRVKDDMAKGIAAHDKGEYEKALKAYDQVTAEYPSCAWAYYEKGFTYLVMDGLKGLAYKSKRTEMYEACRARDPFYWQAYQGSDQQVIQKFFVLGRRKVDAFVTGKERNLETFTAFAEGCEELGLYPVAAHARWKLSSLDPGNIEKHLKSFLALIEKCGCKESDFFRSLFKFSNDTPAKPGGEQPGPVPNKG